MIDQDPQETMQKILEPSVGCLGAKDVCCNSQENKDVIEVLPEHKDKRRVHPNVHVESENSYNREIFVPPHQGYNRPFYQQECMAWANFHPDVQKLRSSHLNTFDAHFYPVHRDPFLVENRIQYMPFKMNSQGYPHEFQFQEFHYFVVIDFEATCDEGKIPHPQEIIEFPSVLVNSATGQLESHFQTYVRPSYHPHLSDFCKELTGIEQSQVNKGITLSEALLKHDEWLEKKGIKHKNFAVVTWSNWDCRDMLDSECRFKGIMKPTYFNRWINLKVPFQQVFGGVRCKLKEAVQLAGLTWEGRPHCGLDDARNTARLLVVLMTRGFRFSITNKLLWQPVDRTPIWLPPPSPDRPMDPSQQHYQRPKELAWPPFQFHPLADLNGRERYPLCFCGVVSSMCFSRKPGHMYGKWFFTCGKWMPTRSPTCNYCMWAGP